MLSKIKNWIKTRRDKKKQAQVDEQAKRYPTNPFTSVDDVPEVYTPAERAALSDDSVSSSSSYGGSSYASDSSSSSSSYDSGSSSCSCGD